MSRLTGLPVSLPTSPVPDGVVPLSLAETFLAKLESLTPEDLVEDAVWRDTFALTGTLRTFYGSEGVVAAWRPIAAKAKPSGYKINPRIARVMRLPTGHAWVDVAYSFETGGTLPLTCDLLLSLTKDAKTGDWKIWVLRTVLIQIKDGPSVDVYEPPPNANLTTTPNGTAGPENSKFDCIIVGAGQAGLNLAGRCAALGLNYLVIESNKAVGENWSKRYDSARLHTIREYSHLPFERTFGDEYPEYLGKDDLARGYAAWVKKYHINVALDTSLVSGSWNEKSRTWTLRVRLGATGQERDLECSFVLLAVGAGGQVPFTPSIPGRETFKGTVLHSEEYKSPKGFEGKRAIVVGTANTAHDVAEDMLDYHLTSTTMVQRSETYVLPVEWYVKVQEQTYNAVIPTALADELNSSNPNAVTRVLSMAVMHQFARNEPERFEKLKQAGFNVQVFGDPAYHLLERLGGHYMDVGCSKKIADGLIKMKSDAAISHYTPAGLAFTDGSEIPADLIVFATGFDLDLSNRVKEFFGPDVASSFGEFSGMNDEGEASGAYRFCHPGLACHGGPIGPSRWYSRFLALAIKAAVMGHPLDVYEDTPVPPKPSATG